MEYKNNYFYKQAKWMLQIMPMVAKEKCFALKGGTAINFYIRNMPRLSVDIDLTYLPLKPRDISLLDISEALNRISNQIKKIFPQSKIISSKAAGGRTKKIFVHNQEVQVTIEPNEILRGSVFECNDKKLSAEVEKEFEISGKIQVLSIEDLYAGKICAALDRQHPRDLFDVKLLLDNEGITNKIRKAFVIYLASHDRPMHELLSPKLKNIKELYEKEFFTMTNIPTTCLELEDVRLRMITEIQNNMTNDERKFLISLKRMQPDWSLTGIPGIESLPSIQWKLANLKKMSVEKHYASLEKLQKILGT